MSTFKDNFSQHADLYVKYRPHYPDALYAFLAEQTAAHDLAWDCGTGNGQAAIGLTPYYKNIIATDPSQQQINNCLHHPQIDYKVEKAEHSSIATNSIDLITIANALHWFDFDAYFAEAYRVLKPNGWLAAWAYFVPTSIPEIDKVVHDYHYNTLKAYWLPENGYVENSYRDIPFPFDTIATPEFVCEKELNLSDFIHYLSTWSATQRYLKMHGRNPADDLVTALQKYWPTPTSTQKITWRLVLKMGKKRNR